MSLESDVKSQYAKFFMESDSFAFRLMAEFYLQKAATLKKRDIDTNEAFKLLLRNVQKRLFIGIGCELLLKALFLRNGYCINIPVSKNAVPGNPPYLVKNVQEANFDIGNTLTFNKLIEQLPKTAIFNNCSPDEKDKIMRALKTAKVFRNKEGHVVTLWHKYDPTNYGDIEKGLAIFYEKAFSQRLEVQFAFGKNQKSKFAVVSV
jgi:hypothetical protein